MLRVQNDTSESQNTVGKNNTLPQQWIKPSKTIKGVERKYVGSYQEKKMKAKKEFSIQENDEVNGALLFYACSKALWDFCFMWAHTMWLWKESAR